MDGLIAFLLRVRDELWRSLGETIGLFGAEGEGISAGFADLLVKVLVGLLILTIFWAAYWLLKRALRLIVTRLRLPADLTRPVFAGLRYTVALLAGLAVLSQFGVSSDFLGNTAVAAVFAFLFYLGWLITNRLLLNAIRSYQPDRSLEQLLRNVLAVVVAALAFVTVMDQFGVDVLGVIAALGVIGIAVGFAAQDTLSNFIAGVTLLIERPFRIGDWVELNGKVGRVEVITLRTTRLVTRDNAHTSIPNATVAAGEIINLSAGGPLRVIVPVGIAYKESAQRAREAMLPVLAAHPLVLDAPGRAPSVLLTELGDSSVNLSLYYWLGPDHIAVQPRVSAEILEGCKRALDEAGIEIPFPHLQLFIDDAKGLAPVLEPFARGRG